MTVPQRNHSEKKPRGKGKPFVKDDPRINRKGTIKPRAQKELEDLLDEIFDEEIEITEGNKKLKMTQLKAGLIGLWRNKNIGGRTTLIERRFGKLPQVTELTGKDGKDLIPVTDNEKVLDRVNQLLELAKQRKEKDAG